MYALIMIVGTMLYIYELIMIVGTIVYMYALIMIVGTMIYIYVCIDHDSWNDGVAWSSLVGS